MKFSKHLVWFSMLVTCCVIYHETSSNGFYIPVKLHSDKNIVQEDYLHVVKKIMNRNRDMFLDKRMGTNLELYNEVLGVHNAVVLSVCHAAKHRFCDFVKSAQKYNVFLHIMGYGMSWMSNRFKINVMNEALQFYRNDTIIVFSDCLDVIFNDEFDKMLYMFKRKNVDMMISVEHGCKPDDVILKVDPSARVYDGSCAQAYKLIGSSNKCVFGGPGHVNSGTYIAYAWVLKEMLSSFAEEIKNGGHTGYSDQKYFHEAYLQKKYDILLDHCVEFAMTMLVIEDVCKPKCPWARKKDDYLIYEPTKSRPSFVHFNHRTKDTIYDKYVNSSMFSKGKQSPTGLPLLWVNQKPSTLASLCPMEQT